MSRRQGLGRRLTGVVLFSFLAFPVEAQGGGVDDRLGEAHAALLAELDAHSEWCRREKLLAERARTLELVMELDPEHKDARRVLGFKKKDGEWIAPAEPKTYVNKRDDSLEESRERYATILKGFSTGLAPLLDDPDLAPEDAQRIEEEILRFDPDNEIVHTRRGELRSGSRWVTVETAVAEQRRAEIEDMVVASREGAPVSSDGLLNGKEAAFGMKFFLAVMPTARVIATSGQEEADKVAEAMYAAELLFESLFGVEVGLPRGCTIYLLAYPEDKQVFLEKHRSVTPEVRTRFEKLDGGGIPNTGDWVFWVDDEEKRIDGIVRLCLQWYFQEGLGVTMEQAWAHEGLGLYIASSVVGTRLNWFVGSTEGVDPEEAFAARNRLLDPDTNWFEEAEKLLGSESYSLGDAFDRSGATLRVEDILASYALAAYLVEGRPDDLADIAKKTGTGEPGATVMTDDLGLDPAALQDRLHGWLVERRSMPDVLALFLTDEELAAAWRALGIDEKKRVGALFRENAAALDTLQTQLMRELLPADEPLETWPEAQRPVFYDPVVHAPAQPIPRRWLAEDAPEAKRLRKQVFGDPDPRALRSSFRYEWSKGEIVRTADPADPETLFANAMNGYPPALDLARAIAVQRIDDGRQRKEFEGFAHAYTDREGNVYPGVTLYDAWNSGLKIEMPDVDVCGFFHEVLDVHDRWIAPIDGSLHDTVYKELEDIFVPVRRYRELREALAETLLIAKPPSSRFGSMTTNFHALWAQVDSDIETLKPDLPESDWRSFTTEWVAQCQQDSVLWKSGWRRENKLKRSAQSVRYALIAALDQVGAFASPASAKRGQ